MPDIKKRVIIDTLLNGEHICLVPVDDDENPRYAIVEKSMVDAFIEAECNLVWYLYKNRVVAWSKPTANRQKAYIDRIIADCGPHTSVFPLDNDPLNLHRNNLVVTKQRGNRAKHYARHPDQLPINKTDTHIIEFLQTYLRT